MSDINGRGVEALNESPSEKEGKFKSGSHIGLIISPSMKVPPKRKGNCQVSLWRVLLMVPQ